MDLLAGAGGAPRPGAKGAPVDSVDEEVCFGKPWNEEGGLFFVLPEVFVAVVLLREPRCKIHEDSSNPETSMNNVVGVIRSRLFPARVVQVRRVQRPLLPKVLWM